MIIVMDGERINLRVVEREADVKRSASVDANRQAGSARSDQVAESMVPNGEGEQV